MIQIFWKALRRVDRHRERTAGQSWRCDPLAHPVLDRMSPAELADLPLGSVRYDCNR